MPTYDFRCVSCDSVFEETRPMGSSKTARCPHCDSEAKRVFTPVAVAFKGTGFHNTDYRPKRAEEGAACPEKSDSSPKCANCPSAE